MNDPFEKLRQQEQVNLRRLGHNAAAALSRLKHRYPNDYPMLHLRVIERCAEIGQAELTLPSPALPSDARLDYALSQMDAWAGGYLPLVSTLADHDDYALLLKSYVRKAWIIYRGISGIEPFGPNRPLGAFVNLIWPLLILSFGPTWPLWRLPVQTPLFDPLP